MPTASDSLASLANEIRRCRRCPGLNLPGKTESAPGYGAAVSPIVLIGQSLCGPCMQTQIPFTGGCGRLIDAGLARAGLVKTQVFITNVVHCHPPRNRASRRTEIANCSEYLARELVFVRPRVIVALGLDARRVVEGWLRSERTPLSSDKSLTDVLAAARVEFLPHPAFAMRRGRTSRDQFVRALAKLLRAAFKTRRV